MEQIKLNNIYSLNVTLKFDNFLDTKISCKSFEIGELLLTTHEDEVFIRQISIKEKYRRKGHSTYVVDLLREYFGKPVCLCVSRHSESAIGFWKSYFAGKNVEKIRGDIYKVA